MSAQTEKGPAPSQKAGPHHAQKQVAAKRTARSQNSVAGAADQGIHTPPEVVAAALIAMWDGLSDTDKARIRPRLDLAPARILTLQQAAHLASRSPQRVACWCTQHGIGHRIGGRWVVDAARLDAFLAGGRS